MVSFRWGLLLTVVTAAGGFMLDLSTVERIGIVVVVALLGLLASIAFDRELKDASENARGESEKAERRHEARHTETTSLLKEQSAQITQLVRLLDAKERREPEVQSLIHEIDVTAARVNNVISPGTGHVFTIGFPPTVVASETKGTDRESDD